MKFANVLDIARWRLCVGCGACVAVCPQDKIYLVDKIKDGIRPMLNGTECENCNACVDICPGLLQIKAKTENEPGCIHQLKEGWGRVLEVWEGYASDPTIRNMGSSGGVVTALALSCIEKEKMRGVIHVGVGSGAFSSKTKLSHTREELTAATGSRYAPASPCDALKCEEMDTGKWVFIGKPCDAAGVYKAKILSNEKIRDINVVISIFCAGTPSTQGTWELVAGMGVQLERVSALRYRGNGWPGRFSVTLREIDTANKELTYQEAWSFLQKYRPYRCHLCPDGTGEYADISCGDPWYREIKDGEEGYSLILVRTEKGRKILQDAIAGGYLTAVCAEPNILERSQSNLFNKRAAVWGRLLAFKSFGLPTPKYVGFPLFENWMMLSLPDKVRSVFGTVRRIIQRKYYRPLEIG